MVTSVGSATSTSSTSNTSSSTTTDAATAALDYNSFLTLLLAQLKNQDPTKPMDSTEYMSQLASFSNVEQSIKMNSKLDELLTTQSLTQAESLIGKTITNSDSTVTGTVESVRVTSSGSVATLTSGETVDIGAGITISGTS
jgi:flagellar basal-body rod modification protein FlgD